MTATVNVYSVISTWISMTDPLVGPYTWPGADEASVVPQREGVVARIVVNVRPDAAFDFLAL